MLARPLRLTPPRRFRRPGSSAAATHKPARPMPKTSPGSGFPSRRERLQCELAEPASCCDTSSRSADGRPRGPAHREEVRRRGEPATEVRPDARTSNNRDIPNACLWGTFAPKSPGRWEGKLFPNARMRGPDRAPAGQIVAAPGGHRTRTQAMIRPYQGISRSRRVGVGPA